MNTILEKNIMPGGFPRLVWSIIYQFLSYADRCRLRATCKWLARFKNQNPMSYWIRRGDPVCLNLGKSLIFQQAVAGVDIPFPTGYLIYHALYEFVKKISVGGNLNNIINFTRVNLYSAYKYGHQHIIKYLQSFESFAIVKCNYIKYEFVTGNFSSAREYHYNLLLKFNAPQNIINQFEFQKTTKLIFEYATGNLRPLLIELKNLKVDDFKLITPNLMTYLNLTILSFIKSYTKNNLNGALYLIDYLDLTLINKTFMVKPFDKLLFKIISGYWRNKTDTWRRITIQFLIKFGAQNIYENMNYLITNGHFHAIKCLIALLEQVPTLTN